MFYCETCRVQNQWTKGIRGFPTSIGNCEMCHSTGECYDVPSAQLDPVVIIEDAINEVMQACGVRQCQRRAMVGRSICEHHAYPGARPKGTTGRRAAVEATRRKLAKVSEEPSEE